MKKTSVNIECYKAGAKACGDGKGGATNPHPPESSEARTWNDSFLDRQKRYTYGDADLYRKRGILHLKG